MAYTTEEKNTQTKTNEISKLLTKSKPKPLKIESDREAIFSIPLFQNFWNAKETHRCSKFTDEGPNIAERVIRTIRNSLKNSIQKRTH